MRFNGSIPINFDLTITISGQYQPISSWLISHQSLLSILLPNPTISEFVSLQPKSRFPKV